MKDKSTIYEEQYGNEATGTGTLAVRCIRPGERYALVAYLPAGMDIGPHAFARGTLDDCRRAYRAAKATMLRWFPPTA